MTGLGMTLKQIVTALFIVAGATFIHPLAGFGASIWPSTTVPAVVDAGVDSPVEVGVKFRSDSSGTISGIRFYKSSANSGPHTARLWSASGALIATATSVSETASGWQQAELTPPVQISANTVYVASYHTSNGHYSYNSNYFTGTGTDNPPLHALANGVSGVNGVFAYGSAGTFPANGWQGTNYWVDVAFTPSGGTPAGASIWPSTTVPSNMDSGPDNPVELGVKFRSDSSGSISGIRFYKSAANSGTHTARLWSAGGTLLATANFSNETASGWQQADFASPVAISANTVYVASYHTSTGHFSYNYNYFSGQGADNPPLHALASGVSGANGVFAYGPAGSFPSSGVGTNYWVDVAFSPGSGSTATGSIIWSSSAVPAVADAGADSPVELGVKFRSDSSGSVSGIRFYKSAANSGSHTVRLWNSSGTLLATASSATETASGWQQADFSAPVTVSANAVYIASYHTSNGHYSYSPGFFNSSGVDNAPLHALANGVSGANGVFAYGPAGTFPSGGWNGTNYWVDLVFSASSSGGGDSVAPVVNSFTVPTTSSTLSVPVNGLSATDTVGVTGYLITESSSAPSVSGSGWSATVPTSYTFGTSGSKTLYAWARDAAGNVSAAKSASVTITLATGGSILIISSSVNPFSGYYAEILRAEGFTSFDQSDIADVSASMLNGHDLVILGEMVLSNSQVSMLVSWVNGGGKLIAMRPDKKLASLLGLSDQSSSLSNRYLLVDTSAGAGKGIASQTMQYHGPADLYGLNGASSLATLYSGASAATSNPAVSLNNVGFNGGQAAAFTYDLARSIIYARQGNPAWSGQERDGNSVIRSDDLYYGAAGFDPQPDWVDLTKIAIPQSDEQQRLLANLITRMNMSKKPLPRFWYLPRNLVAVIVMTGDDHGTGYGGTKGRFTQYQNLSSPGCSLDNWECIRGTSYLYTGNTITSAQATALSNDGFELSLHLTTNCANWTPATLDSFMSNQLAGFEARFPGLPKSNTSRTHCIAWSDYTSQSLVELNHGIRLDTTYYYWPAQWMADNPGFFTGSGMPMRFADVDGATIDVYQAATQMTDESGQVYPFTVDALLDKAVGPEGYFGAFVVNAHTDFDQSSVSDAVIESARQRGVPIISARQLLTWLDGRNSSTFDSVVWNGTALGFSLSAGAGSTGLIAMAPVPEGKTVTSVTRNGSPVSFSMAVIKGVLYARFAATGGSYQVTYAADTASPQVTSFAPSRDARGVGVSESIIVTFSEPVDPGTVNGNSFVLRNSSSAIVPATVSYHTITGTAILTPDVPLASGTTYNATVSGGVRDLAGNSLGSSTVWSFTTAGIATTGATSIWPDTTVPAVVDAGPDDPVELGVKFRSDKAGYITGIRFYKSAANTGTHIANLWAADGTRLATATFNGESSSGWQQVNFPVPVAITANTVYAASYHSNGGHYSFTSSYFKGRGADTPPLHALADGISGANGVYAYGSGSTFPNQGWNQSNYWVDVVFSETGQLIFGGSSFTGAPQAAEPVLTAIKVVPDRQRIAVGTTQQFTAMAIYSDGSTKNVSNQVSWVSKAPDVATVDSSGLVTAHGEGLTTISATLNGITGSTETIATDGVARSIPKEGMKIGEVRG